MPNGIIIIDKPADWTSHDVVAKLRGKLREKRVGHAGTLDPMATGVLPIFVGRATRAVEFAAEGGKEYVAGLRLGVVTDTQDTTGAVLAQRPVSVTGEELETVLERFRGEILQLPPMYSAIKKEGKKLYELARRGLEVEREPRPITIHSLTVEEDKGTVLLSYGENETKEPSPCPAPPHFLLRVRCSKGTYIRTLCHDIGAALGCGGAMCSLRRTMACGFTLEDALPLSQVLEAERPEALLRGVDTYFASYPALTIGGLALERSKNGNPFPCGAGEGDYRVYSPNGAFLLLGRCANGVMTTIKSFYEV